MSSLLLEVEQMAWTNRIVSALTRGSQTSSNSLSALNKKFTRKNNVLLKAVVATLLPIKPMGRPCLFLTRQRTTSSTKSSRLKISESKLSTRKWPTRNQSPKSLQRKLNRAFIGLKGQQVICRCQRPLSILITFSRQKRDLKPPVLASEVLKTIKSL